MGSQEGSSSPWLSVLGSADEQWRDIISYIRKITIDIPTQVIQIATTLFVIVLTVFLFRYRAEMKRRHEALKQKLTRGLVYRDKHNKPTKVIRALELHPEFVEKYTKSGEWKLCSLGQYLSSLRFFDDTIKDKDGNTNPGASEILENELHVVMASLLLQSFGPRIGRALLPMLGTGPVDSLLGAVSNKIVSYIIAHILVDAHHKWDPLEDLACLPFNVMELISFVNLNQKLREADMTLSPIEWMKRGEIGWAPTYHTPARTPDAESLEDNDGSDDYEVLIPNPFIIEEHFDAAIFGLEERIRRKEQRERENNNNVADNDDLYDPEDRSLSTPTPINQTILPDLHMGWGDAKCTHTKREILRNRLFSVLLTKLAYNYALQQQNNDNEDDREEEEARLFVVRMKTNGGNRDCLYPDEFIEGLLDSGHTIELCPRSAITTFGVAVCIKEDDDTWTNVPIGFFFRTGYERRDGRPAYFSAPHGGMDLKIKGPLVGIDEKTGQSSRCDIQFYMAIEGMCGWHSNHYPNVPWIKSVSTTDMYTTEQTLTAIRMCSILACVFNTIGTDMELPFGGYGVLGVCNDTAALVDFAVRKETNMYPLLSTGRFLMHTTTYLTEFCNKLRGVEGMKIVANDADRLIYAAYNMGSDIHCSPRQMIGATRRFLANYPTSYFTITKDSREIMETVSNGYKAFFDDNNINTDNNGS